MSPQAPLPGTLSAIPLELQQQIDQICDAYETSWSPQSSESIGSLLEQVPVEARPVLLRELVRLEDSLRQGRGEAFDANELRFRYPQYQQPAADLAAETVDFTQASSVPAAPTSIASQPTIPGYEITGEIAQGGMGRVYAAHDLTLDREVAIKTLLPGASVDRFVTESKITAKLPHPNIPPVHELGTLADGTPFLAMKLIRGQTLAELLTARPSPLHDLPRFVQVFEQIAQAVGFAHSRRVIHRDLKPRNVMVGEFGEVQVMDWGLARDSASSERQPLGSEDQQRADAPRSSEQDLTRAGDIMGTPGYMAPEQARAEVLDPRADVFALGSTLATILTGKPAFFSGTALEIVQRAAAADLTDVFGRLDSCGADAELIDLAKRCLDADREKRPSDGRAVADEVRAYRDGVEARLRRAETERTAAEVRASETRKRQWVIVWASGIAVSILLAGVVGVALALLEAKRQEGIAREQEGIAKSETAEKEQARAEEARQRGIADEKRQEAEREKTIALTVRDVMKNKLLRQANPYEHARWASARKGSLSDRDPNPQRDITVRQVLDRAAEELAPERIEEAFPGQPLVQAEVLETIGETYEGIKEFDKAVRFVEAAQAIRERHLGADHPNTLTGQVNLVFSYLAAARLQNVVNSMSGLAAVLTDLVERLPDDPAGWAGHPAVSQIDVVLNRILERADPDSFAYPTLELSVVDVAYLALQGPVLLGKLSQLQEQFHDSFGRDDPRCIAVDLWMAFLYDAMGQRRTAGDRYEELLARAEQALPPENRMLDGLREVLLVNYQQTDRHRDRWIPLLVRQYESKRARLGLDHPSTLNSMGKLADGYETTGQFDVALSLFEERLKLTKARFGPDSPDTISCMDDLAYCYQDAGKLNQSLPLFEETFKLRKAKLGADHSDTLVALQNLADAHKNAGHLPRAIELFEELRDGRTAVLGATHTKTIDSLSDLASAYQAAKDYQRAIPLLEQVRDADLKNQGPKHLETLSTLHSLGRAYHANGQPEKAVVVFEQARVGRVEKLGAEHKDTLSTLHNLAWAYQTAGQYPQSFPLFKQVYETRLKTLGPEDTETLNTLGNLGTAYCDAKMGAEASDTLKEFIELARGRLSQPPANFAGMLVAVANDLIRCNEYATAEELLRESVQIREQIAPDEWLTFHGHVLLGKTLLGQKKYSEAEAMLLKGYEGMQARMSKIPPAALGRVADAADHLVQLYQALEKPDDVLKWQEEREKYPRAK